VPQVLVLIIVIKDHNLVRLARLIHNGLQCHRQGCL
jgi:hypothetical protein